MEVIGQIVRHKTLGEGTVEGANGKYLSIRFDCGVTYNFKLIDYN